MLQRSRSTLVAQLACIVDQRNIELRSHLRRNTRCSTPYYLPGVYRISSSHRRLVRNVATDTPLVLSWLATMLHRLSDSPLRIPKTGHK